MRYLSQVTKMVAAPGNSRAFPPLPVAGDSVGALSQKLTALDIQLAASHGQRSHSVVRSDDTAGR